jgi:hypothetical protein
MFMNRTKLVVLGLVLLTFIGCSEEQRLDLSNATLKGKVTYKGQPVTHAMVLVENEKMRMSGMVDEAGNYEVPYAPVGDVKVAVDTMSVRGMMPPAKNGSKFVDIPKKYADPKTSGVTTKISNASGETAFDIVLE